MNTQQSVWLMAAGRYLMGLYFFVPGIAKLLSPERQLALMEHHNIPMAIYLLYVAGIAQVIGALCLFSNRHVRIACLGFVAYIALINMGVHDFWNFTGIEAGHELQNFIKNLGILAGVLVLAGASVARPLVLGELLRSDAAK